MSLQAPLLSPVQLTDLSNNITIQDLNRMHERFISNGGSIRSDRLIEILGGTNAILKHYLSTDNVSPLTSEQLKDINELFHTTNDTKFHENLMINAMDVAESTNMDSPAIFVSHRKSFLHKINGDIGEKIFHFMFNSITTAIMILIWLMLVILGLMDLVNTSLVVLFDIGLVMVIIYQVVLLSLLNRAVTKLIVQSFEFWFKMIYATRLCACSAIRMINNPRKHFFSDISCM